MCLPNSLHNIGRFFVVSLSLVCILAFLDDLLRKMVILSPFAAFAAFAAMFATVAAQTQGLTITSPGGPNLWWGQLFSLNHSPSILTFSI